MNQFFVVPANSILDGFMSEQGAIDDARRKCLASSQKVTIVKAVKVVSIKDDPVNVEEVTND